MILLGVKVLEGGEDEAMRFMENFTRGLPKDTWVVLIPPRVELQRMNAKDITQLRDELNVVLEEMDVGKVG